MLEQILRTIKNYFIKEVWSGIFLISAGTIIGIDDLVKNGQYIKIHGSDLNDGVYQYPVTGLYDEEFNGEVWVLQIPQEIIDIATEKAAWLAANADVINSPYVSESFGGYSYSKASRSSTGSGGSSGDATPATTFDDRLKPWRKARYESIIRRYDYVRPAQ